MIDADAVVIATNHAEFCSPAALRQIVSGARREALVVDPWNCWGAAQVFAHTDEVAALAGLAAR